MVSRKRNKAKDRKAKKIETKRATAHDMWWGFATTKAECGHGCILPTDSDHPVSKFTDDFVTHWNDKSMNVLDLTNSSFQAHKHVWNDENYKQHAINILLRIGTNLLIHANSENKNLGAALSLTRSIIILEQHDGTDSLEVVYNSRAAAAKMRDLSARNSSSRRDALKFYSKRIPCSCLQKMHKEARRDISKTGRCFGCQKEKERVALSVCSRCMLSQYCSRKCQVVDWHEHVRYCDQYVKNHKRDG